jgi:hypothetical protein
MEDIPAWTRLLTGPPAWVVVIGALLLFFLLRTLINRLFYFLAQHTVVGFRAIWEYLTGRGDF